ncbi:MAG: hypothetical protein KTR14_03130 [Vampirovibrio sp.]|nr:hypothetical protein [Vampirovibrio sp.]
MSVNPTSVGTNYAYLALSQADANQDGKVDQQELAALTSQVEDDNVSGNVQSIFDKPAADLTPAEKEQLEVYKAAKFMQSNFQPLSGANTADAFIDSSDVGVTAELDGDASNLSTADINALTGTVDGDDNVQEDDNIEP